jgi:N-acetyl-D-muramate 6-phosphate phosphatase
MRPPRAVAAVLFDFDGTLADTAPDLAGAANDMLIARGHAPKPYESLRIMASHGARGLLHAAFGIDKEHETFEPLRVEFLDRYEARMTRESRLFDGTAELLHALDAQNMPWGIVTNKAARFTLPLVQALGLQSRVTVCGDTTAHTKPHPEPLLHAARSLAVNAADCVYIGDDLRDIQAAKAAGMCSIAVKFGYLGNGTRPESWGADAVLDAPAQIIGTLHTFSV